MKTYKILSIAVICLSLTFSSFAQKNKSETLKVSGNCGMCKKKIETAAKNAGATDADWDVDNKVLTVKYNSKSTNNAKIQEAIAATGYDTEDFKATDESYNKLHGCCKYERAKTGNDGKSINKDAKCSMDGHGDKNCCKKDGAMKMDCCKDGKCTKEGHDGKDCCKKDDAMKMDCCKNGKCEKHGK